MMEGILSNTLLKKIKQVSSGCRGLFFSAPCGFGKTTTAQALIQGKSAQFLSARTPNLSLPQKEDRWKILVVDDLQEMIDQQQQEQLCALLRECPDRQFYLLSRGLLPGWLLPFQTAGVLAVFTAQDLFLDQEATARLLRAHHVEVSDAQLSAILQENLGYPLAVELLAQQLERGADYNRATSDTVRRELFLYYEEQVLRPMDPSLRRMLMELSVFDSITPELARIVTGDPRAKEHLAGVLRSTTMFRQQALDQYRFWDIFRQFLQWELAQRYSEDQCRNLYDRGALYYELNEEYGPALELYTRSGNHAKVLNLLAKNAEMHPGMGHYLEMEPYYRALPEEELRQNPALMQAMSMLSALRMDYKGSERWYQALKDFADGSGGGDAREAKGRLAWLDIALPQRAVESMVDLFPKVFALLSAREIRLPPFSVTSTMPSLMNGGKDFSAWSKRDSLLYATLRVPVEAVLGRDGVGLGDCAIAESRFEKGEDIRDRAMRLLADLDRIRREGTPDIEFAVVGLLARVQIDAGRVQDARDSLLSLRRRLVQAGENRFLPNLDAMLCRIDMLQANDQAVAVWYHEKAPKDPQCIQVLKRYQYLTQAMAQLVLGDPQGALFTLAPLEPYCRVCRRHIDGIQLNVLRSIAEHRLDDPQWRDHLSAALDSAQEFGFVRTISQFGTAVLPLLERCRWQGKTEFQTQMLIAARRQAGCYPNFLTPLRQLSAPLSEAELQVLRLLCAGKSNAEIGDMLHIRLSTVKTHVSHILAKLNVTRRSQVKDAARRLHLVDN